MLKEEDFFSFLLNYRMQMGDSHNTAYTYFEKMLALLSGETMEEEEIELKKEKNLQKTLIEIKKKYGKNSVLKLMNLEEDAISVKRNEQIGGHRA